VHTLRRQVAKYDIRVGAVAPGMVANELWHIREEEDIAQRVAERSALRCEDVVEAVIFMLSRPRHVTIRDLVMLPAAQDL
jgi:ribitol 2-dehydrogenase